MSAAYYPLYELRRKQQIEKENVEILRSYKHIAETKFKNGKGSMVDVLRVDIMLKEAQTNLAILQEKEQPLLATFNSLLNRDPVSKVHLKDTLTARPLPKHYRRTPCLPLTR
ncbi:MAG: TolC family protein [Bacteroidales bacterium]|nr:TolC family protein [Bacteroidales bacterium]